MKDKLKKIFIKNFSINENKTEEAAMKNTEKWDSFSHISLLLEIEEKFNLKKIKPENIAKLTTFKKCLDYLNKNHR